MLTPSLSKGCGHTPVVLRVVILAMVLRGSDFAQTGPPSYSKCTLTNGLATGVFGGVDVSGSFTIGATPDVSTILVSGDPNSVYRLSYTFTGPLNGPGYTQISQITIPCITAGCPPGGILPPGMAGLHVVPQNTSASLNFEDSGEDFIGLGTLSCTTVTGTPPPLPPSEVKIIASGLAYSRVTQTFNGTITLTNMMSGSAISGPLQILFSGLTAPVTLVNATGYFSGAPYLTVPGVTSLAPGVSVTVPVQFKDPSNAIINATPAVYSGSFN